MSMRDVVKKSADPAVNQILVKAHRQGIALAWDRSESLQPQCGFGRLAICCNDCFEGPCRVDPFDAGEQTTICGRDQAALTSQRFAKKAGDGALAMVKLAAEFGGAVDAGLWQAAAATDDDMLTAPGRIAEIGQATAAALESIAALKDKTYGVGEPAGTTANMGALRADCANVVLHGHVAPAVVKALADAAAASKPPLNVVAICGSEISGPLRIPVLTNYDSQEAALLTGVVDLVVVGSQCVMPSLVAAAARASIAVLRSSELADAAGVWRAIEAATAACGRRQGRTTDAPGTCVSLTGGHTAANSGALLQALAAARRGGKLRGLVYLGGCGNLAHTQDADFVRTAMALIDRGYLVASGGCAGTALAKAGLCRPQVAESSPLADVLPKGTPPVLELGSCHDAGEFLRFAEQAGKLGIPVFAVMQELTHNKVLATALAFAARGVRTFLCAEEVQLPENALGAIKAFASLDQLPQVISDMTGA
jgi:hydroxylamine reductase (hybrid-cluster protein)